MGPIRNPSLTLLAAVALIAGLVSAVASASEEVLAFAPPGASPGNEPPPHVVLIAGDEEYRSEETMPMLAKILSQRHGFRCSVLFSLSTDGRYIDPNNQQGLRGLAALDTADLVIIGTRFRRLDPPQTEAMTRYLNAGKPIIGIRTATHAFAGAGSFGGTIPFEDFGLHVLGEGWVAHHGAHKRQGSRGVVEAGEEAHPILNGVRDVFAPSDVYAVTHLTNRDQILMRAAVTESLDPASTNVEGPRNDPMQPFAWLHTYTAPNGTEGTSFCTTAGASIDFVNEDLRRMIVNAAYHLTGREVPREADVDYVDPYYPSFYGFIRDENYWKAADLQAADFALGQTPSLPDPPDSPPWDHRPTTSPSFTPSD